MTEPEIAQRRRLDWVFPALLTVPLGWTMWILSAPGWPVLQVLATLAILAVFGVSWLALTSGARRVGRPATGYMVAVAMVLVTAILLVVQAPTRARWAASRSAFEQLAADIAADPDEVSRRVAGQPAQVGWYEVTRLRPVIGGWLVDENAAFDVTGYVGFAYLPDGPSDDLGLGFRPEFSRLDGPWYTWTYYY